MVSEVRTHDLDYPHWVEPVLVALRDRRGEISVIGIERPQMSPEFTIEEPNIEQRNP